MLMRQHGTIAVVILSLMLAPLADAKRLGGGKSRGMNRALPSQTYQQPNHTGQNPFSNPPPQRSGSNVGRMVGAGVAGAAIGAMAGHALANNHEAVAASQPATTKSSGISWIWLILLALGGFYVYRRLSARKQLPAAGLGNHAPPPQQHDFTQAAAWRPNPASGHQTNVFGAPLGQPQPSAQTLPDGSSSAVFLRFARQRFNHVQAMNSSANLEEIRRYFTPQMFDELRQDILDNDEVAEFTDLSADIVEATQERGQDVLSVCFSGAVSEHLDSASVPFSEVWHFVKPSASQSDWLIAGIQTK